MYIPKAFHEEDLPRLHQMMKDYNFATLFSLVDGEPFATHLPFMLDAEAGEYGTLIAHFARANPHWQALNKPETTVLVVFHGPHEYISPAWYESSEQVPTWNYAAIHAYGKPELIHDPEALADMVSTLTNWHEERGGTHYPTLTREATVAKARGVVGLRIRIERLEGKYKFNQNKSPTDRDKVIATLETHEGTNAQEVARIMKENRERGQHV